MKKKIIAVLFVLGVVICAKQITEVTAEPTVKEPGTQNKMTLKQEKVTTKFSLIQEKVTGKISARLTAKQKAKEQEVATAKAAEEQAAAQTAAQQQAATQTPENQPTGREIGEQNRAYGERLSDPNLSNAERQQIIQEKKNYNRNNHGGRR